MTEKNPEEDKGQDLASETEGDRCKPSSDRMRPSKSFFFYIRNKEKYINRRKDTGERKDTKERKETKGRMRGPSYTN